MSERAPEQRAVQLATLPHGLSEKPSVRDVCGFAPAHRRLAPPSPTRSRRAGV